MTMSLRTVANGKICRHQIVNHTFTLTGLIATMLVFTSGIQIASIAMQPDARIVQVR